MEGLAFGRYRVTKQLGEGGMATVWAAKHELIDQEAAVKVLLPEMSQQQHIVKRFFNEAQAAARIKHPGIVDVFDVGYTPDGRAYIILELLAGESLYTRIKRLGTLPVDQTVTLMRQLAGVMQAAHEGGIVHRDLKPENLFIVPDPEVAGGERVKVLDFGLAKLAEGAGSVMTAQGAIFGTPAYMAPEQCYDAGKVDARADLYAIGCIFYRCLCGRPPFGTGGVEIISAQLTHAVVPPRRVQPAIPPHVDHLIMHLLAKQPDNRPQSCAELIARLDGATEGNAVPEERDDDSETMPFLDAPTLPPLASASAITLVDMGGNEKPAAGNDERQSGGEQGAAGASGEPAGAPGQREDEDEDEHSTFPDAEPSTEPDGAGASQSSPTLSGGQLYAGPPHHRRSKKWIYWVAAMAIALSGLSAVAFMAERDDSDARADVRTRAASAGATPGPGAPGQSTAAGEEPVRGESEKSRGGPEGGILQPHAASTVDFDSRQPEPLATPDQPEAPDGADEAAAAAAAAAPDQASDVAAGDESAGDESGRPASLPGAAEVGAGAAGERAGNRRDRSRARSGSAARPSRPDEEPADHAADIRSAYRADDFARAAGLCREAGAAVRDDDGVASLCVIAACKAGKASWAKSGYRRLPTSYRNGVWQSCFRAGLSLPQP